MEHWPHLSHVRFKSFTSGGGWPPFPESVFAGLSSC